MNKVQKQLLALFVLIGASTAVKAAYEYDLVNMIGDPIVVKINQERVDNKDYYQIVFPGKTVKQTFPAGNAYCLKKLAWAPYNKTAPLNGGLDLVNKTNLRIPEEKQREFGDKIAPHYAFIPMDIIMQPNEVFQETRKAAANLAKGIDKLSCQTINEVKDFMKLSSGIPSFGGGDMGGGMGGDLMGGDLMGGDLMGGGTVHNRDTGDVNDQLKSVLNELKNAVSNSKQAEVERLITDNRNLLEKHFSKVQIGRINFGWQAANKGEALKLIDDKLATLSSTKTSMNHDQSLLKTSMDIMGDDMGMGMGGGMTQTQTQKKCNFGLGKIAKASGKLAGYTLCKSREYIIYYKVDNSGLPMFDKYGRVALTATTVEGQ